MIKSVAKRIAKSIAAALATCLLSLSLFGCTLLAEAMRDDPTYGYSRALGTTLSGKIVDALNARDESALKKLFSENCRNYQTEFDEAITDFMNTVDDLIVSYEFSSGYEEKDSSFGKIRRLLEGVITLHTESEIIYLDMYWITVNDFDKRDVGIKLLYLAENHYGHIDYGELDLPCGINHYQYERKRYGVFVGGEGVATKTDEEYRIESYSNAIRDAYIGRDESVLTAQFSENARQNPELTSKAQALFDYVESVEYLAIKPHMPYDEETDFYYPDTCPRFDYREYTLVIKKDAVRECYFAYPEMKNSDYTLCLLYCIRDDVDPGNVGLTSVLYCPTSYGYDFWYTNESKYPSVSSGIFFGADVKTQFGKALPGKIIG